MECTYPGCTNGLESGHVLSRWEDDCFYCPDHFPGTVDPLALILQQRNFSPDDTRTTTEALHDAGYILTEGELE